VDDDLVGSVDPGDIAREDKQGNAHGRHEGGAENDGSVAGVARSDRIAAADGLADTNGGGGGKAEGNHVREGDSIERDLVAGLCDGAQARDESCNQSEDSNFRGELESRGEAKSDEFSNACEIGLHGSFEKFGFVARVIPEKIRDKNESEISAGDAGGDAGAGDAISRKAEFAKDENVVSSKIDEVGADEGEGDGANHVHALEGTTNSEVKEEGEESGGERAHIGSSEDGDGVGNAEVLEVMRNDPHRNGEEGSDSEAEVDAVDQGAVAIFAMASAEGLGDQRVEADENTFAEESEDDEEAGGNADGADRFGGVRKAADHHGVDNHHAHPPDLGKDEGKGEAEGGAEFTTEDGEEGHEVER